jgi:HK97 family phage major capsid protein
MLLQDLQLKRGQLGTEAHRILTTPNCSAEQRTKAAAMLDEADSITTQIDLLQRAEQHEEQTRRDRTPAAGGPRPAPGADNPDAGEESDLARSTAYRNAFEVYIRGGERALRDSERSLLFSGVRKVDRNVVLIGGEKRDLTVGSTGNYIVPQNFYSELISAKKYMGNLFASVRRKTTPGNGAPMKIGFENDTANTLVVVAENTTVTESDPTLSGIIQSTDTLASLIKVSKQELADSGFSLDALFRDRLGKRYLRGLENFIANGDGGGNNIASIAPTTFTTTLANTGPTYADFLAAESLLDVVYEDGAAWFMNKATRNYVMGQLDTLNRPLFLPNPQSGMLDQILGFPIKLTAYLPSATTAAAYGVIFGDPSEGYLLRDDGEMTIQRLDERYADQLMVGFLAYTRVGGSVTDAGTHPLVGLKTHV